MNATLEVVCYLSKTLKDSTHPLMLRISKNGRKKYLSLGISVNQKHWDLKKQQPKPNCPNREYLEKLILKKKALYQNKILEFTASGKEYTPQTLVDAIEITHTPKTVEELYTDHIKALIKAGKIGNSQVYSYSLRSLQKFTTGKLSIPLGEITVEWLKRYENWLIEQRCQGNTISQLFRSLRSIYNRAIDNGLTTKAAYPFDKFKVSRFNTPTKKRAISKTEIKKLMALDLTNEDHYMQLSLDLFIFRAC